MLTDLIAGATGAAIFVLVGAVATIVVLDKRGWISRPETGRHHAEPLAHDRADLDHVVAETDHVTTVAIPPSAAVDEAAARALRASTAERMRLATSSTYAHGRLVDEPIRVEHHVEPGEDALDAEESHQGTIALPHTGPPRAVVGALELTFHLAEDVPGVVVDRAEAQAALSGREAA